MTEKERIVVVAGSRTIDIAAPRKLFRLCNGQLVRVPDNERDPTKPYRTVDDGVDTYDVELTKEEELENARTRAAWEADQPRREEEKKRQEQAAADFRESLKYGNRIVAFLDVLGWSEAIEQSIRDPNFAQSLGIALHASMISSRLVEEVKKQAGRDEWFGDPQITQFSDSILLSVAAGPRAEETLVFHLHAMIDSLLRLGFFARGGITEGQLIHKGSILYGPVILAACQLERKVAVGPRVVLDEPLAQKWGGGTRWQDVSGRQLGHVKYWRQDEDGYYFYDFLYPIPGMLVPWDKGALTSRLEFVHSIVAKQIESRHVKEAVMQKRAWFAGYFNKFCDEHGIDAETRMKLP